MILSGDDFREVCFLLDINDTLPEDFSDNELDSIIQIFSDYKDFYRSVDIYVAKHLNDFESELWDLSLEQERVLNSWLVLKCSALSKILKDPFIYDETFQRISNTMGYFEYLLERYIEYTNKKSLFDILNPEVIKPFVKSVRRDFQYYYNEIDVDTEDEVSGSFINSLRQIFESDLDLNKSISGYVSLHIKDLDRRVKVLTSDQRIVLMGWLIYDFYKKAIILRENGKDRHPDGPIYFPEPFQGLSLGIKQYQTMCDRLNHLD